VWLFTADLRAWSTRSGGRLCARFAKTYNVSSHASSTNLIERTSICKPQVVDASGCNGTMPSMCARYDSVLNASRLQQFFRVRGLREFTQKSEVFPGLSAPFIRRPKEYGIGDEAVPNREVLVGRFGLLPHWAKNEKLCKSTYNARSETVATKPAFRDAWKRAQHCIIPIEAFWEPDWRTGKAKWTRIARPDGTPMGIAGLWSWWRQPGSSEDVHSFSMVTINADEHPFMRNFHRPDDEKRMVVVLREEDYDAWLDAPSDRSLEFMRQCPPEHLVVSA
jgi:putative SOS response-associated peptidase YedK